MDTITISKKEYQTLIDRALKYEYLASIVKKDENFFECPPVKNAKRVVSEFRKTKLYSEKFLNSLEGGLKRSSYFQTSK